MNDELADEIEHLYSLCSADWISLKQDFEKANRREWVILCDQGLRNLETLRRTAQEAVGEVISQDIAMRELRDQRDRAMEAHVAALRRSQSEGEELISKIFRAFGITDYPMNRKMMRELLQSARDIVADANALSAAEAEGRKG